LQPFLWVLFQLSLNLTLLQSFFPLNFHNTLFWICPSCFSVGSNFLSFYCFLHFHFPIILWTLFSHCTNTHLLLHSHILARVILVYLLSYG
jgi:hypothetical protein